ncbi:MAG: ATP-binding protein [Thermodesulfobacteriota bacterium]
MNQNRNSARNRIDPDFTGRLYYRAKRGAIFRAASTFSIWCLGFFAYLLGLLNPVPFLGLTAAALFLLLINPPILWDLARIRSASLFEYESLLTNALEAIGYTAVIYFCGGIEASFLVTIYFALVAYLGMAAPKRYSYIIAAWCAFCFTILLLLEHFEFLPHYSLFIMEPRPPLPLWPNQIFRLLFLVALLLLMAHISASTAGRIRQVRERLRTQNLELEDRVAERTSDLKLANEKLRAEIEERGKAEQALRVSEEKYRTILESLEEGYHELDLSGRYTFMNEALARILEHSAGELLGLEIERFMDESTAREFKKVCDQALKTDRPVLPLEWSLARGDGGKTYLETTITVLRNDEGRPTGFKGFTRDVTEEKKLKTQLMYAQKIEAIGTLAGGLAHDFNNLLMGLQGNISLMLLHTASDHPHAAWLRNMEKLVHSGARITAQLLGYARKGRYELRPLDVKQVIRETAETFGRARKDVIIVQELAQDLALIEVDQGQIEQVLLNLYVNAGDAMPNGGTLTLRADNVTHEDMTGRPYEPKPGRYVRLEVADTGLGMEPKVMERIFDPFFTTKQMGRGTGLGLASCYGIVKAHGGYIDVISELGQGATFSIFLPVTDKPLVEGVHSAQPIISGRETILLVDDEEMILQVGAELLEQLGYTVFKAGGAAEALAIYRREKDNIDLVILDMIMPGVSGGEIFDRFKAVSREVKVLLSSGYSLEGQAAEIMSRGCNGFLQKPFNLEQLSRKVRDILDK